MGQLIWSVISILSKTQLALTLAGVAGIIVSIGITVDRFVVYFERVKDEVRHGRSLRKSAARGFPARWRTILAANFVSLLGAVVLLVPHRRLGARLRLLPRPRHAVRPRHPVVLHPPGRAPDGATTGRLDRHDAFGLATTPRSVTAAS